MGVSFQFLNLRSWWQLKIWIFLFSSWTIFSESKASAANGRRLLGVGDNLNWSWHLQSRQLSFASSSVQHLVLAHPPLQRTVRNSVDWCSLTTCIASPESWLWESTSSLWTSTICPGAAGTVSSSDMSRSPSLASGGASWKVSFWWRCWGRWFWSEPALPLGSIPSCPVWSFLCQPNSILQKNDYLNDIGHKPWCPKCPLHDHSSDIPGFNVTLVRDQGYQPDSPLTQLHCCVVTLGLSWLQHGIDSFLPDYQAWILRPCDSKKISHTFGQVLGGQTCDTGWKSHVCMARAGIPRRWSSSHSREGTTWPSRIVW